VFVVAVDASLSIPAGLTVNKPREPFHPPKLVAALRQQRAKPIWFKLPVPPARSTILADVLEDVPSSDLWHDRAKTDEIVGMMAPLHRAKLEAMRRAGKRMVRGLSCRTRSKVTRWEIRDDDAANCLRTAKGSSSYPTIVEVDGDAVKTRLLSPRECCRLMGLGDPYRLPVGRTKAASRNKAYNLFGDGVAAPVVRFLAQHVLEPVLQATDLSSAAE
jgi:DNA (cytosine-5)-methyltransferase 1